MGFPSCSRSTEGTVLGYYLTRIQTVRSDMTRPQIEEQNRGQITGLKVLELIRTNRIVVRRSEDIWLRYESFFLIDEIIKCKF